jgi:hypothetical protein
VVDGELAQPDEPAWASYGDVSKVGWVEYSQMAGLAVIASFMFLKRGW